VILRPITFPTPATMRQFSAASILGVVMSVFAVGFGAQASDIPNDDTDTRHVAPVAVEEIHASIDKGFDFLLADQNKNGSWGSPTRTKSLNIYAPVPGAHHGFRGAVTSLCVSAIIESGRAADDPEIAAALVRGEDFLLAELPKVRRSAADALYNVWTHAYGIRCLIKMRQRALKAGDKERAAECIRQLKIQIDLATRYESVNGGWGYYDFAVGSKRPASSPTSFTTATMLVAFHEVENSEPPTGIDIDDKIIEHAIAALNRQRLNTNSYTYGEYLKMRPFYDINRPGGSLGRSQACNYALWLWGDETITDEVFVEWLMRLRDRNGWLDIGRKRPVPHESWFGVAGYFFYYGHFYAGHCVEALPDDKAAPYANDLAHIILALQEKDGSWWDFPFYDYHQPYGTAYAIMTLQRCLPTKSTTPAAK
jgi:hypothetical protein